jgi:hypothetical protein
MDDLTDKNLILEKNISDLKQELSFLKEEFQKLKIQKISEELQLPEELVANSPDVINPHQPKRGKKYVPLLESDIRRAQEHTNTAMGAARFLKVHFCTYKKYAKLYGIWKVNAHYKHEGWVVDAEKGKYPLSKILNGEFPEYPVYRLKDKLIHGKVKKPECEQCGFKERRITDNKIPLLLNFEDGNQKNHRLENIKLLCYNCTFLSGKGYVRKGKKYHVLDDPDRVQGAEYFVPNRF